MQDLKVVGVESDALLLMTDDGGRFRIRLEELGQAGIATAPRAVPSPVAAPTPSAAGIGTRVVPARRVPPRELQALLRSGLTAVEVAERTGAEVAAVERFEAPVAAERTYVVDAALAVPVHSPLDTGPLGEGSTFGAVIARRLSDLAAVGERWSSWKDVDGPWIVQVRFAASGVDHDARWSFDAKRQVLSPDNPEATRLSQVSEGNPLIPRLRAVSDDAPARFDSGAFTPIIVAQPDAETDRPAAAPVSIDRRRSPWEPRAVVGAEDDRDDDVDGTADLLEDLRRRRGERQSAPVPMADDHEADELLDFLAGDVDELTPADDAAATETADAAAEDAAARPMGDSGVIELPFETASIESAGPERRSPRRSSTGGHGRRGRAAMPSWDEIVFGTKSDDDPA